MCLLPQKKPLPHTALSVHKRRIVDGEPSRDKAQAILINLTHDRVTPTRHSVPLCCLPIITKLLYQFLTRIVVMNEHISRQSAQFDPLFRPLLPWRSPCNFNPIAQRWKPTDDWTFHCGLGRLCGHFENYFGYRENVQVGNLGKQIFIQHNNVFRTQKKQLAYILT